MPVLLVVPVVEADQVAGDGDVERSGDDGDALEEPRGRIAALISGASESPNPAREEMLTGHVMDEDFR